MEVVVELPAAPVAPAVEVVVFDQSQFQIASVVGAT